MNVQKSFAEFAADGALYIVGTPIGNLEDMTYRAVRILKEADCIAAEDTRQTRKLLSHFAISAKLYSYHEHNKQASGPELIRMIKEGKKVALVSDAGMPAISDPGYDLVKLAVEAGITVIPIPGPNAALSALVVSGLPTDRFLFAGFLPREKKKLADELERLGRIPATMLFYESPRRIGKTLEAMRSAWGNVRMAMARELTKRHEEIVRGTIDECLLYVQEHEPLGEYCLAVDLNGGKAAESEPEHAWWEGISIEEHVAGYERECGDRKEAMKRAASDRGISKRDVYQALIGKRSTN